ncbi:MAG: ABC transporter permease [Owenweeksia sp.]|nr:ABC transporter permease [Owenweeksia sp.]
MPTSCGPSPGATFRIRYAQTYLGFTWGIVQPLLGLTAVFVLFFKIAGIGSGETPYLAFALSGIIFWNYFYYVVTQATASFVNAQAMIKKVYFPRLSLPISKVIVGLVDLLIGIILLIIALSYYNLSFTGLLITPVIWFFTAMAGLGLGLMVSGLSLRYRDLQQVLPFTLQLLFFLTPVAYPAALFSKFISENKLWLTYLNPMTGLLELLRHFLFGEAISNMVYISLLMCVLLFVLGLYLFSRVNKKMADLV